MQNGTTVVPVTVYVLGLTHFCVREDEYVEVRLVVYEVKCAASICGDAVQYSYLPPQLRSDGSTKSKHFYVRVLYEYVLGRRLNIQHSTLNSITEATSPSSTAAAEP